MKLLTLLTLFFMTITSVAFAASERHEGRLEIAIEDYSNGSHKVRQYLRQGKKRLELKGQLAFQFRTDDKIRVRGSLKKENNRDVLELDQNGTNSVELLEAAIFPQTYGDQRVAVILVNFQDNTNQPISVASAQSLVFGATNSFFKENSFQQMSISGDVMGYFTIPMSGSVCDAYQLASLANTAATNAGYTLSNYARKVYFFPRISACGWAGLGNVGGSQTMAWVNGSFNLLVVAHEMGHNLGLRHAHALNCSGGILQSSCTNLAYGDPADTMGNNRAGHYNAFEKELLGWLNVSAMPPIASVTSSGRYQIEPYSAQSAGTKALKIPLGNSNYYYVEFRQPIGVDSVLNYGNMVQGVMIRSANITNPDSSFALDMTPDTSTSTFLEMADGALAVGRTFVDSAKGVAITLVAADSLGAVVDVQLGTISTTTTLPPSTTTTTLPPVTTTTLPPSTTTTTLPPVTTTTLPPSTTTTLPPVTTTTLAADTQAPSVAILSPSTGSSVRVRSSVAISATANDNVGLNRVDFYVNGSLACSDSSVPYSCNWKVPGKVGKSHLLEARAIDRSGNVGRTQISVLSSR